MIWFTLFTSTLVFSRLSVATPSKSWHFAEMHAWAETPKGWELYGPAPADHMLNMRIGLKQDKLDELISSLYEVSDPAHERYGAHLSKEEVEALVSPHPTSLSLVESWLADHGIDTSTAKHSGASSWLTIDIPVSQAERMLNTKYHTFFNALTSSYVVRTLKYSLPRELHDHIDVVIPTTYFGSVNKMKKTSFPMPHTPPALAGTEYEVASGNVSSSCASIITPTCLRSLYNSSTYVPKATANNSLGIVGFGEQYANNADLQTFFKQFRTDAVNTTFQTVLVNGGLNNQSDPGGEANLDIQYGEAMSFPTPNIYYNTGGSYIDWLNFILAETNIPQTVSVSYGDDEQSVPPQYATSVCNLFAQLGARGSSVLFASGDDGVGAGYCLTNDGTIRFLPNFPASCPFVTAVGGTTGISPETAISFSSGGFSNYFSQPSYQASAVNKFLTALGSTTITGLYNASGRAYPDVSAQAQGFQIVVGGRVGSTGGTSCSAPTFAGIVALLNDDRLAKNKPPLGFLNPFLYSNGTAGLNDITSGSNPGCGTNGFTARVGWDPVTGLGTPNFGLLMGLV